MVMKVKEMITKLGAAQKFYSYLNLDKENIMVVLLKILEKTKSNNLLVHMV